MAYRFSAISSGGVRPRSMPSSPAARQAANARYGLQDGSGLRSSSRVSCPRGAGMRMRAERLDEDHAMLWGASYPEMSRLYEFTSGLVSAQKPCAWASRPAMKLYASGESFLGSDGS